MAVRGVGIGKPMPWSGSLTLIKRGRRSGVDLIDHDLRTPVLRSLREFASVPRYSNNGGVKL